MRAVPVLAALLLGAAATLAPSSHSKPSSATAAPSATAEGEIRLVIRGDDIGMTHGSLEGAKRSFAGGVMTCASVIVPAPWFEAAARLGAESPDWCVGVHLCLFGEWKDYRWRPVLPYDRVPSLVDENGYLFQHPRDLFARKPPLAEIEAEFRAQIDLARKRGLRVDYLDTHMMSPSDRTYPGFDALFERLSRDYGVPVSGRLGERRFGTPAEPFETKVERTVQALAGLEPGLWLWVEHPGIESAEQAALRVAFLEDQPPRWIERERAGVTALFTDPRLKRAIEARGIRLVDYRSLSAASRSGAPGADDGGK